MSRVVHADLESATSAQWSVLGRMHFAKCSTECDCYTPLVMNSQPGLTHLFVDEAEVVLHKATSVVAKSEGGWVEIIGY